MSDKEEKKGVQVVARGSPEEIGEAFSKQGGEGSPEEKDKDKKKFLPQHLEELASDSGLRIVVHRMGPVKYKRKSVVCGRCGQIPAAGCSMGDIEDQVTRKWGGGEFSLVLLDGRGQTIARQRAEFDGAPCREHLEGEADLDEDDAVAEELKAARVAEAKKQRILKEQELKKVEGDPNVGISPEEHEAELQRVAAGMRAEMESQKRFDALERKIEAMTNKKEEAPALMAFLQEQQKAREEAAKERERNHEKEMTLLREQAKDEREMRGKELEGQRQQFQVQLEMMKGLLGDKKGMYEQADAMLGILEKASNVMGGGGGDKEDKGFLGDLAEVAKNIAPLAQQQQGQTAQQQAQLAAMQQLAVQQAALRQRQVQRLPQKPGGRQRRAAPDGPATQAMQQIQPGQGGEMFEDVSAKVAKSAVNLVVDRLIVELNMRTLSGIDRMIDMVVTDCPGDLLEKILETENYEGLGDILKPWDVPLAKMKAIRDKAKGDPKSAKWLATLWEDLKEAIGDEHFGEGPPDSERGDPEEEAPEGGQPEEGLPIGDSLDPTGTEKPAEGAEEGAVETQEPSEPKQ